MFLEQQRRQAGDGTQLVRPNSRVLAVPPDFQLLPMAPHLHGDDADDGESKQADELHGDQEEAELKQADESKTTEAAPSLAESTTSTTSLAGPNELTTSSRRNDDGASQTNAMTDVTTDAIDATTAVERKDVMHVKTTPAPRVKPKVAARPPKKQTMRLEQVPPPSAKNKARGRPKGSSNKTNSKFNPSGKRGAIEGDATASSRQAKKRRNN